MQKFVCVCLFVYLSTCHDLGDPPVGGWGLGPGGVIWLGMGLGFGVEWLGVLNSAKCYARRARAAKRRAASIFTEIRYAQNYVKTEI